MKTLSARLREHKPYSHGWIADCDVAQALRLESVARAAMKYRFGRWQGNTGIWLQLGEALKRLEGK